MPSSLAKSIHGACGRLLLGLVAVYPLIAGCSDPVALKQQPSKTLQGEISESAETPDAATPPDAAEPTPEKPECSPMCEERECGDNGCGGQCGSCKKPEMCDKSAGKCVACEGDDCPCSAKCERRSCGDDGCGGVCGKCDEDEVCTAEGRCRRPTCGNGMVEGAEECDGDEFCRDDCVRLTPAQSTCMFGPGQAEGECKKCGCLQCTQEILDCYLSGDAARDAACRTIGDCGVKNGCANLNDCICGTQQCRPPNGPCLGPSEEALGMANIGLFEIRACFDDPDCALYRANAFGACAAEHCADICKLGTTMTTMP
jgi:hypothetical protein